MISDKFLNNIIEKCRARDVEAEVSAVEKEIYPVNFEANRLKSIDTKFVKNCALRIIKNGRFGYINSDRLDAPDLIIDSAIKNSRFGVETEVKFPNKKPEINPLIFSEDIDAVGIEKIKNTGREIIDSLLGFNSKLNVDVGFTKSIVHDTVANSSGLSISQKFSDFSIVISCELLDGDNLLQVFNYDTSIDGKVDHIRLINELKEKIRLGLKVVSGYNKQVPVIFSSFGNQSILNPLLHALNGSAILFKTSPLCEKIGQKLFDDRITIYDDSTIDGKPGSFVFDDEGVPSQKTRLFEKGIFKNFITDLQTASRLKVSSSGNGFRTGSHIPLPMFTNVIFQKGKVSLSELVSALKEGVIIEQVMGAGMGNVYSGDFSNHITLAFKIENGEIVGKIKDAFVSGNIFKMFNRILDISSDFSKISGGVGEVDIPYILFDKVKISSKKII